MKEEFKKLEGKLPFSIIEDLKEYFNEHDLTKKQKKKIIEKTKEQYKKSTYEPGEALGVISAQSISEPATQMTMRTYHVAGGAKVQVTLGLPKLIEVVDARRNPSTPAMTVYLEDEYDNKEGAKKIASEIKETNLRDIATEDSIDLVNLEIEINLNKNKIENLNLSGEEIISKIKKSVKKTNVELEDGILKIKPKKEATIRDLQKMKVKAMNTILSGIKGINQTVARETENGWEINTLGSNLRKVLKIEGVDSTKTRSNDIREMKKVLGIEACRNSIIKEASETLEDQGLNVDIRHIMLVADTMTVDGDLKAIGRYGISGEKGSVLARANFEVTVRHLTQAAIEGEEDELNSVVENVLINQVVPVGTGMCELEFKPPKK